MLTPFCLSVHRKVVSLHLGLLVLIPMTIPADVHGFLDSSARATKNRISFVPTTTTTRNRGTIMDDSLTNDRVLEAGTRSSCRSDGGGDDEDTTCNSSNNNSSNYNTSSNKDGMSSERRSLRRQIPFVETFEEQIVRELWEKDPFDGNEYVVNTVITESGNNGNSNSNDDCGSTTVLTPVVNSGDHRPVHPPSLSGYEDSFDPIYKSRSGRNDLDPTTSDTGGGGVSGTAVEDNKESCTVEATTASIAASTFAWIPSKSNKNNTEKMQNFYLQVAYNGNTFCGWQTQLKNFDKPSVQRTLEEWLTELQNNDQEAAVVAATFADAEKNAERKRERRLRKQGKLLGNDNKEGTGGGGRRKKSDSPSSRIKWADLPVAGRTDSGVSAIGQVCRFRTHRKDLTTQAIGDYLTNRIGTTPGITRSLGITRIAKVSRAFHPTFSSSCRAYAYLIDVDIDIGVDVGDDEYNNDVLLPELLTRERAEQQVALLDGMLRKLEGKALDYIGLSYGKVKTLDTICTLHHARAKLVQFEYEDAPGGVEQKGSTQTRTAVCIELVGNRFLRRMVRLLVESSMRLVAIADKNAEKTEQLSSSNSSTEKETATDALLKLVEQQDRTIVGRPAPPNGLIFVGARLPLA